MPVTTVGRVRVRSGKRRLDFGIGLRELIALRQSGKSCIQVNTRRRLFSKTSLTARGPPPLRARSSKTVTPPTVFQESTADDAVRAIAAAERAYAGWRLVPAPRRAEMLFRAAQLVADRKEQFARDMTREMGKVLEETRGDVQEAIDMTFFMAGEGRRMYGQTVPSELRDKFAMSVRQPLGVCGVITPWNFPMAIPSWKIVPALVCGNTVVFKPSSLTPLSAVNFVQVLAEAGVPPGVVNMVTGGPEVGTVLS